MTVIIDGDHRFLWGPHARRIKDLAEGCVDYLRRITRSLSGELGTGRHYVTEKAEALRDSAQLFADACHDVNIDVLRCGADVVDIVDGMQVVDPCTLPSGHDGDHSRRTPATPIEHALTAARELRGRVLALSDSLGWMAHRGWCQEDLVDLDADVLRVRSSLSTTVRAIEAVAAEGRGGGR